MTNDAANHRVAFLSVPGLSDDADKIRHNGMHHLAFEYDGFADLMSSYDRMRKGGVEPAFCLDHGLTISLYYRDPEGNFVELTPVKQKSGKTVHAWAIEGSLDETSIQSNSFEMEWPPKSGKKQSFPEIDKAGWYTIDEAKRNINPSQIALLDELIKVLGVKS